MRLSRDIGTPPPPEFIRAYTLVELAIVLVIIGLIVGGTLAGRALIHAAEVHNIVKEYRQYVAAVNIFQDKYKALPGDMTNATAYWGTMNGGCPPSVPFSYTSGTCNGDGNGRIENICGSNDCQEQFWFWQQLALAGLIDGTYSGQGSYSVSRNTVGLNVPASRYPNAAWSVYRVNKTVGDTVYYTADYGNYLLLVANNTDTPSEPKPVITPLDAYSIDVKMDDGMPGTGNILGAGLPDGYFCSWNAPFPACPPPALQCNSNVNSQDYTGIYEVTNDGPLCALNFIKAF